MPSISWLFFLSVLTLGWAGRAARAAGEEAPPPEAFQVSSPRREGPAMTPFLHEQIARAWAFDDVRRARFEAVSSSSELRALQDELRAAVLETIGGLPAERTPLNARLVGTISRDGYRIEKVVFESLPGLHVTALVYVPEGTAAGGPRRARLPAVLLACGHSPIGKAHPGYQEIAARLARRGYVVLCWDPVGQGERSQFWDAARGRSRYNLVCGEHAVLGNLATLAGFGLGRYFVWDAMRAADYLLGRDDVDPKRLSVTGTSGGGFQSLWLGALDERVQVVAPSCFPTSLPMRMANRIFEDPDSDPEQDPMGLVSKGVDHAGLLLLAFPRPVHVAAAIKDFFPIEGTRKTMREVGTLYRRFGREGRFVLTEGYHDHRYSEENQEAAFAFLDRWNAQPARSGIEKVETLPEEALRCTRSGQVRVDLAGRSLVDVIREDFGRQRPVPPDLDGLYRSRPKAEAPVVEAAGSLDWGGYAFDRYRLQYPDGPAVPVVHVHPRDRRTARAVLDFGLDGKATAADWPALRAHLEAGREVVTLDPRGLGETRMRYRAASVDDPSLAPVDENQAYAHPLSGVLANHVYNAQLLGRPYVLEMVSDLEAVARFTRQSLGVREIGVAGRGDAAVVAALARRLLPEILAEGEPDLGFWRRTLDQGGEVWPVALLLPGGAALGPEER